MTSLAERLGRSPDARLLIVSCDELGFSYAANVAIFEALRAGQATSASLMVPAPWARGARVGYHDEPVGVHLTLNAELDWYRWGPITQSPSLLDGDGAFPRTIEDVWEHADLDEVHREWRAQIERAVLWGFSIDHLDAHLSGVELKPEFFDVYLELADEFRLPVRLPAIEEERRIGFPFRALAEERGVVAPDDVVALRSLGDSGPDVAAGIAALEPGVHELHVHPAIDTPELRASSPEWATRVAEHELLGASALKDLASTGSVELIGYGALKALMA